MLMVAFWLEEMRNSKRRKMEDLNRFWAGLWSNWVGAGMILASLVGLEIIFKNYTNT